MKEPKRSFRKSLSAVVLLMLAAVSSQAQIQTLANNNSFADINPNNQQGMFDWFVDGQNQLFQQWFWYRVGNDPTGQHSIDTIAAPLITRPDAATAYIVYNNGAYSVEVDYTLTGQSAGSGQASIREDIRIHNFTASPLDFHFYQYSDFNLLNNPNGDNVALGTDLSGRFNEALQTKGPLNSATLSETDVTPGANHGEVNFAGVPTSTLNKLNGGLPATLNDNAGPLGPGNMTWALEWDYSGTDAIAAGGDALISKQKFLQVPEPSACALMALAVGACIWRRRCRS
jgi:hypothetical protein